MVCAPGFKVLAFSTVNPRIKIVQRRRMFGLDDLPAQLQIRGKFATANRQWLRGDDQPGQVLVGWQGPARLKHLTAQALEGIVPSRPPCSLSNDQQRDRLRSPSPEDDSVLEL